MAAAEAARRVLASASGVADALQQGADPYQKMIRGMILSISQLDDVALEEQLQRALLLGTTTTLFDRVLAPTLVRVGQLWHDGRLSIAHEHFATQRIGKLVRDLTRLAIGGEDAEPALVACFADEDHEIGALGVALRLGTWGMRPIFFGARMPPAGVRTAVEAIGPKLVALSVTLAPERARARELVDGYAGACGAIPWMVGGAGVESIADLVANAGGLRAPSDSEALRAAVRSALGRAPRRGATRAPRRKTP
jgi:methanogenic corrinoid protein MtbC1